MSRLYVSGLLGEILLIISTIGLVHHFFGNVSAYLAMLLWGIFEVLPIKR